MASEAHVARAAFLVAAALFLLSLPWPEREPPPCRSPREADRVAGRSVAARCDGVGPTLRGPARLLFGLRLDPNRASAESLTALPGIGPVRAAGIVAARAERPFRRIEDLERVPGIGPATRARIAPWLAIEASPTAPGRVFRETGSLPKTDLPAGEARGPSGGID